MRSCYIGFVVIISHYVTLRRNMLLEYRDRCTLYRVGLLYKVFFVRHCRFEAAVYPIRWSFKYYYIRRYLTPVHLAKSIKVVRVKFQKKTMKLNEKRRGT